MGVESFVARRYLTARRKQAFISVITFISALGITIGVAALIIAVALITGFQEDVQDKILSATSHLMISDLSGDSLPGHAEMADSIRAMPGVASVSPVVLGMVLVAGPLKTQPAMVKGMDLNLERRQSPWLAKLEVGSLPETGGRDGRDLLARPAIDVADPQPHEPLVSGDPEPAPDDRSPAGGGDRRAGHIPHAARDRLATR